VLSFTTHLRPRGNGIQFAAFALIAPVVLGLVGMVVLRFAIFREPPTLAELERDFPSKRTDLEMILRMSDQDVKFSRIAPDFLDRTPDSSNTSGRYSENDPRAGLPGLRWDAYRKIYSRNGINLGIQRDPSLDAFIMVDSVGLLNRGHTDEGYSFQKLDSLWYAYDEGPS
jgi:hypothetical protein